MDVDADVDRVVDASEEVLTAFEDRDEAAYAEVGGVVRRRTDAVVTEEGVRESTSFDEVGLWWRVYAGGGVDYRFTTSLDEDHLDDLIERSIRSGTMLDHGAPPHYDPETVHRATHPGWGDRELAERAPDRKAGDVADALDETLAELDVPIDRARVTYTDEVTEETVMTTTGSTIHQTVCRAAADSLLVPSSGPKLRDHVGTSTGTSLFDELPAHFDRLADRAREATSHDAVPVDDGEYQILLGAEAAGELFHQLSHYFELDTAYIGSSPLEPGDELGPEALDIEDTVHAGSWTARAYDAEGRPTQPTSLVSGGTVTNRLADVSGAVAEAEHSTGCFVPSIGYEDPPRIHARHLDVSAGDAGIDGLRAEADLHVERFGDPRFANEATRVKRSSTMPPSTLYAREISEATPPEHADEATEQVVELPVAEGYRLGGDDRAGLLSDATVEFELADVRNVSIARGDRRTVTGTCTKHRSHLPYAVTAPPVLLTCRVSAD